MKWNRKLWAAAHLAPLAGLVVFRGWLAFMCFLIFVLMPFHDGWRWDDPWTPEQ